MPTTIVPSDSEDGVGEITTAYEDAPPSEDDD